MLHFQSSNGGKKNTPGVYALQQQFGEPLLVSSNGSPSNSSANGNAGLSRHSELRTGATTPVTPLPTLATEHIQTLKGDGKCVSIPPPGASLYYSGRDSLEYYQQNPNIVPYGSLSESDGELSSGGNEAPVSLPFPKKSMAQKLVTDKDTTSRSSSFFWNTSDKNLDNEISREPDQGDYRPGTFDTMNGLMSSFWSSSGKSDGTQTLERLDRETRSWPRSLFHVSGILFELLETSDTLPLIVGARAVAQLSSYRIAFAEATAIPVLVTLLCLLLGKGSVKEATDNVASYAIGSTLATIIFGLGLSLGSGMDSLSTMTLDEKSHLSWKHLTKCCCVSFWFFFVISSIFFSVQYLCYIPNILLPFMLPFDIRTSAIRIVNVQSVGFLANYFFEALHRFLSYRQQWLPQLICSSIACVFHCIAVLVIVFRYSKGAFEAAIVFSFAAVFRSVLLFLYVWVKKYDLGWQSGIRVRLFQRERQKLRTRRRQGHHASLNKQSSTENLNNLELLGDENPQDDDPSSGKVGLSNQSPLESSTLSQEKILGRRQRRIPTGRPMGDQPLISFSEQFISPQPEPINKIGTNIKTPVKKQNQEKRQGVGPLNRFSSSSVTHGELLNPSSAAAAVALRDIEKWDSLQKEIDEQEEKRKDSNVSLSIHLSSSQSEIVSDLNFPKKTDFSTEQLQKNNEIFVPFISSVKIPIKSDLERKKQNELFNLISHIPMDGKILHDNYIDSAIYNSISFENTKHNSTDMSKKKDLGVDPLLLCSKEIFNDECTISSGSLGHRTDISSTTFSNPQSSSFSTHHSDGLISQINPLIHNNLSADAPTNSIILPLDLSSSSSSSSSLVNYSSEIAQDSPIVSNPIRNNIIDLNTVPLSEDSDDARLPCSTGHMSIAKLNRQQSKDRDILTNEPPASIEKLGMEISNKQTLKRSSLVTGKHTNNTPSLFAARRFSRRVASGSLRFAEPTKKTEENLSLSKTQHTTFDTAQEEDNEQNEPGSNSARRVPILKRNDRRRPNRCRERTVVSVRSVPVDDYMLLDAFCCPTTRSWKTFWYIQRPRQYKETIDYLHYAIPSCILLSLEWFGLEWLILLAGCLGTGPVVSLALLLTIDNVINSIALGIGAAVTEQIRFLIRLDNIEKAYKLLKLSVYTILGLLFVTSSVLFLLFLCLPNSEVEYSISLRHHLLLLIPFSITDSLSTFLGFVVRTASADFYPAFLGLLLIGIVLPCFAACSILFFTFNEIYLIILTILFFTSLIFFDAYYLVYCSPLNCSDTVLWESRFFLPYITVSSVRRGLTDCRSVFTSTPSTSPFDSASL